MVTESLDSLWKVSALSIMGTVAWSKQEGRVGARGLAFGLRDVRRLDD
jgi:hypothetical protein